MTKNADSNSVSPNSEPLEPSEPTLPVPYQSGAQPPSSDGSPDPMNKSHRVDPPTSGKPPQKQPDNPWVEALKTVGLSLVLALGIRHFVAEARYIPSKSMEPTLEVNDRLIVEKISYLLHPPERMDIIVFMPPEAAGQECPLPNGAPSKDAFIKRVIGLPGETVEVTNGQVLIDNEALQENYIYAPPNYQWGPETVPADSYLVLGDNRNNSCDGHFWGFVPRENIIGQAVFRFWPLNRLGGIRPMMIQPLDPQAEQP